MKMFRRAAHLHAKCTAPPSAHRLVIRQRPRDITAICRRQQHSTNSTRRFSYRPSIMAQTELLPSSRLKHCVASFSSNAQQEAKVKDRNKGEEASPSRYIDAATHATLTTLKNERRQRHNNLYNKAAKKKEMNRRRILAEDLMRVFASNDEFFHATLREMNVSSSSSSDSELHQYRQFYLDSLPSFGTVLSGEDEDALTRVGLSAASSLDALNHFATTMGGSSSADDSNASSQAFSKKYRTMAALSQKEEELNSTLKQVRQGHEDRLKELHSTLFQLQRKHDKHLREVKEEEDVLVTAESRRARQGERLSSLEEKVASTKESIHYFDESEVDELDRIEKEITEALNKMRALSKSKTDNLDLEKQGNRVRNAKAAAANLAKKVEAVESEISGLKRPMTHAEFESTTNAILTKVAPYVAPALAEYIADRHEDFERYRQLATHTDLTKPHEWYPRARLDKRKIIFHAGPTNSGKTYEALQRLKKAEKGMYLAPLRLLAAETYENLTAEGIYTELLTGQEHRKVPFSTHRSSTVELASLEEDFDVVVIDEIQMLCDEFRGFAWTRALLGVRCKEVHVCGGAEAIDIVKKICRLSGDDFELHRYKRFSDLKVLDESLAQSPTEKGSYRKIQPGDCVVAFSKKDIFAIKREIEHNTPFKCCVIYGSLPPNVRAEQARRFNDPDSEYKILVASDAIGMGLNLSIKRIIFNTMFKHNGDRIIQLDHSAVKQIAGRAGRRNSPYPHGEVTCRDPDDMAHLKKCMGTEIRPLRKAGVIPTPSHIAVFNQHLQEYDSSGKEIDLHTTLRKFSDMATLKGDFFLCREQSMEIVSRWLKDVKNMSTAEKFALCMSPVNESCTRSKNVLMKYIETYTSGKVPGLHYSMQPKTAKTFDHLADLCSIHHQLELFLWLQNKLPSNAVEVMRAEALKERTIQMINSGLFKAEKLTLSYDYISKDVRIKKEWASERRGEEDEI